MKRLMYFLVVFILLFGWIGTLVYFLLYLPSTRLTSETQNTEKSQNTQETIEDEKKPQNIENKEYKLDEKEAVREEDIERITETDQQSEFIEYKAKHSDFSFTFPKSFGAYETWDRVLDPVPYVMQTEGISFKDLNISLSIGTHEGAFFGEEVLDYVAKTGKEYKINIVYQGLNLESRGINVTIGTFPMSGLMMVQDLNPSQLERYLGYIKTILDTLNYSFPEIEY